MVNITINLTVHEFTQEDQAIIQDCLGLTDQDNLVEFLSKLCKASFMEYIKMFREKGLPTRADEVQQERLFFLLLYYFENKVPLNMKSLAYFRLHSLKVGHFLEIRIPDFEQKLRHLLETQ